MAVRYSTALSHLVHAGISIYCIQHVGMTVVGFPQAAYGIMAVNSIVGAFQWSYSNHGLDCEKLHRFTWFLQGIFALACITTSIWLKYNFYMWQVAYAHTFVSFIPLMIYLSNSVEDIHNMVHLFVVLNIMSLGVVSFMNQNWFGVGAAGTYAFDHFVIREDIRDWGGIPALDCYNYVMCIFAYVSAKAIGAI